MYQHKSFSLADQVFEKLENNILRGVYTPGELLTETRLSDELNVSRTPVREALRRLRQENLVADSTKGSVVLGISEDDIKDIYEIRLALTENIMSRYVKNATDADLQALKNAVDLQDFYCNQHDNENVMAKDSEFHDLIYVGTGSHIFAETLASLHKKLVKYRRASIEHIGRAAKSIEEHKAIYNALSARDAENAVKLMNEHIANARDSILKGE